ncbi:MAG: tetratricopeptide repeat protein, partial [SAR324 cluster bacterium]|nr:tetratricopeptide repeat protein [SAR324 cluster bacterium]
MPMRSAASPKRWRRSCATTWVSLTALLAAILLPVPAAAYTAQEARKLAGEFKNDGVRAYQNGRVSEAVEKLSAAININLNDFFAHFYLGLAFRDLRRYTEARQVLEVTTHLDPRYLPSYVALGDVALGQGNPDEARTWFQTALNRQATYSPALDGMGRLAEARGDEDAAIISYRQAIDANRGYPDPYVHLGALYHRQDRVDDAIALFQEAIHFQPGFAKGYLYLGIAYGRLGRRTQATSLLAKAAELKPEDPEPHIALGDLLSAWEDRIQASQEYEAARLLGPERFEPLRGLAELARRQGRYQEADDLLDQALAMPGLSDNTRTQLLSLQTIYRSEARRAEAARHRLALARAAAAASDESLETPVLEVAGFGGPARELGWSWLELARLRHDAGDLAGALDACREALTPLERPVDLVGECGFFALQARDWGPARELLGEAAARDETDVRHLINLALAYTGLGHLSSTVETLQRALAVDARSAEAHTYL